MSFNTTQNNSNCLFSNENIQHFFNVYVCTFLVCIGLIGNLISVCIFIRSVRHAPKILTRTSLILLTFSNLMYLTLVWYFRVLGKLDVRFYYINSNVYVCKLVIYLINLAITLNALITVRLKITIYITWLT